MIFDKPGFYWISVVPSNWDSPIAYKGKELTKEEYLDHWGKWVLMDEREKLDELAAKLDPYVESGAIQSIKYSRSPEHIFDIDSCVMCVFCDDRDREEVWQILSSLGVTLKAWVYDRQVIEMWQPGGMMMEKWLSHFGVEGEEAEEIRHATKEKYEKWLSYIGDEEAEGPWSFELIK